MKMIRMVFNWMGEELDGMRHSHHYSMRNVRKYSFSRRATNELIRFPADYVNASSINEAGLL